jgi:hypothetical protein
LRASSATRQAVTVAFVNPAGRGASVNQAMNSSSPRLYTRRAIGDDTLSSTSAFNRRHSGDLIGHQQFFHPLTPLAPVIWHYQKLHKGNHSNAKSPIGREIECRLPGILCRAVPCPILSTRRFRPPQGHRASPRLAHVPKIPAIPLFIPSFLPRIGYGIAAVTPWILTLPDHRDSIRGTFTIRR